MNRRAETERIIELREDVERILANRGIEIDLGPNKKVERALKANHPDLVQWLLIHALARALQNQPTVTAEDLEAINGVGPQTADRIVRQLS